MADLPAFIPFPLPDAALAEAQHYDLRLGWRAVHPDLRSRDGYRYPFPGGWADAGGPILDHSDACPRLAGDGLCVAKTWKGAASGGIPASTVLLVGYHDDDVYGEDDHKVRVGAMLVLDVVDVPSLARAGNLTGANLGYAYLRDANLRYANLGYADLGYANLRYAYLRDANLGYANLRYADLWGADLRGAYLWGADLRGAYLRGADLWGADLRGANLWGADLGGAYLRGADLWGADLRGADLRGADLGGAYLRGADLRGADLGYAYLRGAWGSADTCWPDGFDPVTAGVQL